MTNLSTVAATSTGAMIAAAARRGINAEAIALRHGVAPEIWTQPGGRLQAETVPLIWEALSRACRDPALHLWAAQELPFGAYRVIDQLARTSSRVSHGMGRLSRYFRLIHSGVCLSVRQEGCLCGIALEPSPGGAQLPPRYVEYTFAVTLSHFRHIASGPLSPALVAFTSPQPAYAQACRDHFGPDVRFAQPANLMLFSQDAWDRPHLSPDAGVCEILESHADLLMAQVPCEVSLQGKLKVIIQERLVDGPPRLEALARAVGMSPRSLQRHLSEEQVSYRDVLDGARQDLALTALRDPAVGLCEVAFLLGFAEQSTFQRAFRRWTGTTPGAWRAGLQPPPTQRQVGPAPGRLPPASWGADQRRPWSTPR